jgi:hypothetical protein
MKRILATALAVPVLAGCSTTLASTEVLSIDNTQNVDPTADFTVDGSWDLSYHWDCSSQQSEGVAGADRAEFDIINSDDDTLDSEHPMVVVKGRSGGSSVHFVRSGTFHILVTTPCSWRLAVDEAST